MVKGADTVAEAQHTLDSMILQHYVQTSLNNGISQKIKADPIECGLDPIFLATGFVPIAVGVFVRVLTRCSMGGVRFAIQNQKCLLVRNQLHIT